MMSWKEPAGRRQLRVIAIVVQQKVAHCAQELLLIQSTQETPHVQQGCFWQK